MDTDILVKALSYFPNANWHSISLFRNYAVLDGTFNDINITWQMWDFPTKKRIELDINGYVVEENYLDLTAMDDIVTKFTQSYPKLKEKIGLP